MDPPTHDEHQLATIAIGDVAVPLATPDPDPNAALASRSPPQMAQAASLGSAVRSAVSSSSKAAASLAARPLSGLFGVNKPSGPTSMSLLDQLKPLFASSPLFADANGNPAGAAAGKKRGKWGNRAKHRGGRGPAGVFGAPKLGQGGTLDPLADGVLVIGVGGGTKHLQKYLDCTKEYRTTALLGTATTSYDCCDPVLSRAPYHHVDAQLLGRLLPQFTGSLLQIPPLYSAVRIDGKRLFEYAREGLDLPRPIEARKVRVEELRLVDWLPAEQHSFKPPSREIPDEEKALVGRVRQMAGRDGMTDTRKEVQGAVTQLSDPSDGGVQASAAEAAQKPEGIAKIDATTLSSTLAAPTAEQVAATDAATDAAQHTLVDSAGPPAFTLEMTVSSGTYVRSIIHDLAMAAKSAAHVQVLTRTRQGEWSIDTPARPATGGAVGDATLASTSEVSDIKGNCLPWQLFADAIVEQQHEERDPAFRAERDEEGLRKWERELLRVIVPV